MLKRIIILSAVMSLAACGSSDNNTFIDETGGNPEVATPDPSAQGDSIVDPIAEGPIAPPAGSKTTENFGNEGNLWKPSGDDHGAGAGNLVVIISSKYSKQFDSCSVPLRDGTTSSLVCINNVPWTHTPYSCFANGNRQHWRANFKCSDAAEIKATCRKGSETYVFTVEGGARANVCGRYG